MVARRLQLRMSCRRKSKIVANRPVHARGPPRRQSRRRPAQHCVCPRLPWPVASSGPSSPTAASRLPASSRPSRRALAVASSKRKSRADHRIVVPDPHPDILLHLRSQSRSKTLFQKQHKHQLRALLWQHPPPLGEVEKWQAQDPQNRVRSRYTLHSFKRGAAAIAWQAVVDRKISLQDLLLLLKHQDVATALEYCPCPLTAARAAGTSAAALTAI